MYGALVAIFVYERAYHGMNLNERKRERKIKSKKS